MSNLQRGWYHFQHRFVGLDLDDRDSQATVAEGREHVQDGLIKFRKSKVERVVRRLFSCCPESLIMLAACIYRTYGGCRKRNE